MATLIYKAITIDGSSNTQKKIADLSTKSGNWTHSINYYSVSDSDNIDNINSIGSVTYTCTFSSSQYSTGNQFAYIELMNGNTVLATSNTQPVYFNSTNRPQVTFTITDLSASEIKSITGIKLNYTANTALTGDFYLQCESKYPATLTINYTIASKYTITYQDNTSHNSTNYIIGTLPNNTTVSAGSTYNIPSPTLKNRVNGGTYTIRLYYNYNNSDNSIYDTYSIPFNVYHKFANKFYYDGNTATTVTCGSTITVNRNYTFEPLWIADTTTTEAEQALDLTNLRPTRTGYTFNGWYTAREGGNSTTLLVPTGDTNLYAHWTANTYTYTIQFNGNGDDGSSIPSPLTANGTSTSVVMGDIGSSVPIKTGYVFRGWSASREYNNQRIAYDTAYGGGADYSGNSAKTTSGNWTYYDYCYYTGGNTSSRVLTLYAQWEKQRYTVSYDANGGSGAPGNQIKTHGVNLTLSSTKPTKESTTSTSYPSTITINYDSFGVSSVPSPQSDYVTKTTITPYSFSSWNTNRSGTGTSYSSGGTYSDNANVTLYAQYRESSSSESIAYPSFQVRPAISRNPAIVDAYTVDFNANNGSTTPSSQTSTCTASYTFDSWYSYKTDKHYTPNTSYEFTTSDTLYSMWDISYSNYSSITLPNAISKNSSSAGEYTVTYHANDGSGTQTSASAARTTTYTFAGWNTKPDGTGTTYSAGSSYKPTSSHTLHAKWNSSTSTASITLPTPTREDYTFIGWATSANADANSVITGDYTPEGDTNLYAIWERNTYTITYKYLNFTGETALQKDNKVGEEISLYSSSDVKSSHEYGAHLIGWSTTVPDGLKYEYELGASYIGQENITLYGVWAYYIDYDANDGIFDIDREYKAYSQDYNISTIEPTRTGYTFEHWEGTYRINNKETNKLETENYDPGAFYTWNGDLTLKAIWTPISYDITYEVNPQNGGTVLDDVPTNEKKDYDIDYQINFIPSHSVVIKDGYTVTFDSKGGSSVDSITAQDSYTYTFNGWKSSSDDKIYEAGAIYTQNTDTTFTAQWKSTEVKGSITLPISSRTGYTFKGWATSADATSGITGSYMPTGNVTLYAVWGQNVRIIQQPQDVTVTVGEEASTSVIAVGDGLTYQWYYINPGSNKPLTSSLTVDTYTVVMNSSSRIGRQIYCVITDEYGNTAESDWVTLNAQYKIIYNANEGTGTMSESIHNCRVIKALNANTFTRKGYAFVGWATSNTATTPEYVDKERVIGLTYNKSSITLYAVWEVANFITTITKYVSGAKQCEVYYYNGTKWVPIEEIRYYKNSKWVQVGEQIPYIEP